MIGDFIREMRIKYHAARLKKTGCFNEAGKGHYAKMTELIKGRSRGQVERMERKRGLQ